MKFLTPLSLSLFLVFSTFAQNHCLNLDGIDDYIDLGDQIGNNGIRTIELWFKPDVVIDANSDTDYTALIARNNIGENCEFGVYFSEGVGYDGHLAFGLAITNNDYYTVYSDQNSWMAGKWYHVAATVDQADGMKLYVDGVLQSQTNPYTNAPCTTDDITTLGTWGDANIRYFDGSMDEVRLWDFAKSQAEVQADMDQALSGNESGLIAYYGFNQGIAAGNNANVNVLDDLSSSFNGALSNFNLSGNSSNWLCSQNFSAVDFSNALNFDGTDDYIDLGDQIGNSGIRTIELWFKPDVAIDANSGTDYTALIARNNIGENCEFGVYFSEGVGYDGHLAFGLAITNNDYYTVYSDQNSWMAGKWYHVAATVDQADGMKLYVDGVLQSQTTPYMNAPCTTDDITTLGTWGDANIRYFNGSMDEVRLWDFARTQAEVQADMNHELTGTESGLIAYYNFNQGESGGSNPGIDNLNDLTSNGYTGDLMAFTLDGPNSNWVCADINIIAHSNEPIKTEYLTIFPNPTAGELFIDIDDDTQFTLQVFDLTGRLLLQKNEYRANQSIELIGLTNGLYYVSLTDSNRAYIGKVVVQR